MRGRTNVTQRTGLIYPNGDIISAIVQEGYSVQTGDFVEYKTDYAEKVTGSYDADSVARLDAKYLALRCYNDLKIFDTDTMEVTDTRTLTDLKVVLVNDGSIYCCSEGYKVTRFSASNGILNVEAENVVYTGSYYLYAGVVIGDKILFSSKGSSKTLATVLNKQTLEIINQEDVLNITTNGLLTNMVYYNGYIYEIVLDTSYIGLRQYSFTDDKVIYAQIIYIYSTGGNSSDIIWYYELKGDILFLVRKQKTATGSKYYPKMFAFNLQNLTFLAYLNIPETNPAAYFSVSNIADGNTFITMQGDTTTYNPRCIMHKYDETTNSFVQLSDATLDLDAMYNGVINIYSNKAYFFYTNKVVELTITSENAVIGEVDKNYVRPFSNSGNPLGFAKTAGTAGTTIQVYVPHET